MLDDKDRELAEPDDATSLNDPVSDAQTSAAIVSEEQESAPLPYPIVAIAASAGGLEAYIELFRSLALDTGMAFVVAPHLSPEHESHLAEILGTYTRLPVRNIEPDTIPQPNQVYVLPAGALLTIEGGRFRLQPRETRERIALPIDRFLMSLASDQKNRAVGVLLSGADSDGSLGLKAIKGEGGIAIVQDPATALFGEMPRSGILADHVDLILRPSQIAAELSRVARQFFHPSLQTLEQGALATEDEPYSAQILALLQGVSGVDFSSYKPGTLRRRIARRMILRRFDSLADYARYLRVDREELRNLQEDVLIGVTRFFRDASVFDTLKALILPRMFENRPPDQQVRIWIAGCSTGEEVFTIAICLLEYLSGVDLEPPIQIFGTDASEDAVDKARAGLYPKSICADVSPERLRRFFVATDRGYQVAKRVRDLCIFAAQNLCVDPPFSRVDLISCRNVLIYLDSEMQRTILATFHYALKPRGALLLGSSESVREMSDLFRPLDPKNKFFAKQGATPSRAIFAPLQTHTRGTTRAVNSPQRSLRPKMAHLDWRNAADHVMLTRYAPAAVVVNKEMEILDVRGRPAPFLAVTPGAPTTSVVRMAHLDIKTLLRDALQRAIESGNPASEEIRLEEENQTREAVIDILPLETGSAEPEEFLIIFLVLRQHPHEAAGQGSPKPDVGDAEQERAKLRRDLGATKVYLRSLIEERDLRSEELTGAYEEIQSANEELQSTNEEMETAKEELQSTNEELQTVNDELRDRNRALVHASNDLANLLNSVNIPVIMLGSDLTIRQYTPPAERLMFLRPTDLGRPVREIRLNLLIEDFEPMIREVLDTLATKEMDVQDRSGKWHLLRLRPYRTAENKIEGVVIVLLDIDEMRRTKTGLEQARDFAQAVLDSVYIPVIVLHQDLRLRSANAAFRALSRLESPDLIHRSFPELLGLLWDWPDLRPSLEKLLEQNPGALLDVEHETEGTAKLSLHLVARVVQAEGGDRLILVVVEDFTARKRNERLLESDHERLAGQVRSATEVLGRTREELQALAGRLFTSQEEERRRVARELHDDVSQRLAALGMELDRLRQDPPSDPHEFQQRVETFQSCIYVLGNEVRDISHRLHPSAIEHLGLSSALRSLVTEFGEREGMPVTFLCSGIPEGLPLELAGPLYRIAQEALRNVAKHAGRTHVKVALESEDDHLTLRVRDFGNGFDMEGAEIRSLGFISMSERARLAGGTFSVTSGLGEGTTVTVRAPMPGEPS